MKRIVMICLAGLLFAIGTTSEAMVETLNCKAYMGRAKDMALDLTGKSKISLSSMIQLNEDGKNGRSMCFVHSPPLKISFGEQKNIIFTPDKQQSSATYKTYRCADEYIMSLLGNGKLIFSISDKRSLSADARWQCDKGRDEVLAILDNLQKPTSTDVASSSELSRLKEEIQALKDSLETAPEKVGEVQSSNSSGPKLSIISMTVKNKRGQFTGRVSNPQEVLKLMVDGQETSVLDDGTFKWQGFVPARGVSLVVRAIAYSGTTSEMFVSLQRTSINETQEISYARLNPVNRAVKTNPTALALIFGIDGYKNTPARAIYADIDAEMFADYASEKLGIPSNRIKTLVNHDAGERELLLSVKSWLSRSVKQDKTDVYIFFAGHGLASDDGQKMYLLPYDGAPELLDDTAISRERLFSDIASANPRSVTVFLDTCYSGTTRGTDMLIASRPIAIRALEQSIPDNFTVMTAAAADQTAKPLEEVKHGMFSYFLMKVMEGKADANNDNQITAGELHAFVQQNVVQQSSGSQTPELQGNRDRVLVRFQ